MVMLIFLYGSVVSVPGTAGIWKQYIDPLLRSLKIYSLTWALLLPSMLSMTNPRAMGQVFLPLTALDLTILNGLD